MKTAVCLAIAAALAVQATPLVAHRDIDVDSLDSVPDPTVDTDTTIHYDLAVELEDSAERTACQPQPQGKGPRPKKDTPEAFVDFAEFSVLAWTAWIPKLYLPTFQNLKASNSARAYMGYTQLDRYDPAACAAKCDAMKGCHSKPLPRTAYLKTRQRGPSTLGRLTKENLPPQASTSTLSARPSSSPARDAPTRPPPPTSSAPSGGGLSAGPTPTTSASGAMTSTSSSPAPTDTCASSLISAPRAPPAPASSRPGRPKQARSDKVGYVDVGCRELYEERILGAGNGVVRPRIRQAAPHVYDLEVIGRSLPQILITSPTCSQTPLSQCPSSRRTLC